MKQKDERIVAISHYDNSFHDSGEDDDDVGEDDDEILHPQKRVRISETKEPPSSVSPEET